MIQKFLCLFIFCQYNQIRPTHSAVRSMHTALDSTKPLRTQMQNLYLSTNTLDLDLQMKIEYCLHKPITFDIKPKKLTSNHRALLYLYISMVRGPWAGRLTFYFLTLFLGRQPFDSTHYNSRSMHFTEPFP